MMFCSSIQVTQGFGTGKGNAVQDPSGSLKYCRAVSRGSLFREAWPGRDIPGQARLHTFLNYF